MKIGQVSYKIKTDNEYNSKPKYYSKYIIYDNGYLKFVPLIK